MELLRWDSGCIREISLDKRCVEDSVPGSEGEEIWLVPEIFKGEANTGIQDKKERSHRR